MHRGAFVQDDARSMNLHQLLDDAPGLLPWVLATAFYVPLVWLGFTPRAVFGPPGAKA